jgi:hypothetical protein
LSVTARSRDAECVWTTTVRLPSAVCHQLPVLLLILQVTEIALER